jgi:hypothetical protein
MLKMLGRVQDDCVRNEVGRSPHDAFGRPPHHKRNLPACPGHESPVIPVSVRQDDCEEARTAIRKPVDTWKRCRDRIRRIQRQPQVEQDSTSCAFQFDTRAADLARPPMNSYSHSNPLT